jgi:hypothetical protein
LKERDVYLTICEEADSGQAEKEHRGNAGHWNRFLAVLNTTTLSIKIKEIK